MKVAAIGQMIRNLIIVFFLAITSLSYTQISIDTNAVIYGWVLDNNYTTPVLADIDTILVNFQLHNSVVRKYQSLTTIGSNGSPYLANSFFQREEQDDLLFLNSYNRYLNTYDNTIYINTRKPFTHLQYIFSNPKSEREEYFNAFHSQNINEKLNFGFDVSIVSDKAQYKYINANNKAFKLFSSYKGRDYTLHTSINMNRYFSGESGGIVDSSYTSSRQLTREVPTQFTGGGAGGGANAYKPDVTNRVRYVDGMISQSLKLFSIGGNTDDSLTEPSSIAQPIVSHVMKVRRASKIYENSTPENNQYYLNNYSNLSQTYDSIAELRFTNTIQLDFKTKLRKKVIAGVYGNIGYDYIKYNYFSLLDSSLVDSSFMNSINGDGLSETEQEARRIRYSKSGVTNFDSIYDINTSKSLSNIYVSGGLYGKFWTNFQSRFNFTLFIAGYKAGQTKLDGFINTNINIKNRPYQLYIAGTLENIIPSYQLSNYYSNNYVWEESFNSINKFFLSSKLAAPSNRFELEGNYTLLSNYIYLTDSSPAVYSKPISISALTLQKEFVVWKLHSYTKLTYQVSENRSIIELPSILVFNSTYIDKTFRFKLTNGWLRTMIGFDVYYNTGFNGYNYNPSLAMFYQQGTTTVGNYPYIDVWLNVRLKRTRFFLKYEHVNASDNINHFYAVNYPAKRGAFKFGLSWTFYD